MSVEDNLIVGLTPLEHPDREQSLSESYAAQGVDVIFRVSIPSAERTA